MNAISLMDVEEAKRRAQSDNDVPLDCLRDSGVQVAVPRRGKLSPIHNSAVRSLWNSPRNRLANRTNPSKIDDHAKYVIHVEYVIMEEIHEIRHCGFPTERNG